MRLVIATCSVDYVGRLTAHLPKATRLLMVKADGSVSVHADDRAYKPLNWMTPPCTLTVHSIAIDDSDVTSQGTSPIDAQATDAYSTDGSSVDNPGGPGEESLADDLALDGLTPLIERHDDSHASVTEPTRMKKHDEELWVVENKKGEQLRITVHDKISDTTYDLGEDPGLTKDGVEAHLQELLAQHPEALGEGFTLVRREYPTPIGPVDILTRDASGKTVAVEVKRRGGIDGVEQLTRYVELLNRDEILAPVEGLFAAQEIKPQARTLAEDRGFTCVTVDYDELRGTPSQELRLF